MKQDAETIPQSDHMLNYRDFLQFLESRNFLPNLMMDQCLSQWRRQRDNRE